MPRRGSGSGEGPSGFLPVAKPPGITSFDAIRVLRRTLGIHKLGHSGVLDRPASGVLVVGANKATRLFELFSGFEKEYEADFWLGVTTTTDDLTGAALETRDACSTTREQFEHALEKYRGAFDQTPPAFSLAKKAGRESYRYALAGETVEVAPRHVAVLDMHVLEFEKSATLPAGAGLRPSHSAAIGQSEQPILSDGLQAGPVLDQPLPMARVWVRCTGGLYVRSLARDTGAALGVGAALGRLVRTRVGPFRLDDCLSLEQVAQRMEETRDAAALLRPMASIAPEDARIELDETQLALVRSGRNIRRFRAQMPPAVEKPGDVAYGLAGGELVAVLSVTGTTPQGLVELKPDKVVG